jgi:hypothetical protein
MNPLDFRGNPDNLRELKSLLSVALSVVLTFSLAGGIAVVRAAGHAHATGPGRPCHNACGNGASHDFPCGGKGMPVNSSCPFCALCSSGCAANVVQPDAISVLLLSSRLASLPGWDAARRTYPPPLPPPRVEAS